ncbi:hypothetical protein QJS04_geneDACA023875 [Acorus gramineus]|uniref:Transposase MuDR plant domain-containing protein n=1 Tax=Acorus gramineus TaxID=55184 RepID=A0AAV9BPU8_ACOGR|nr:hypothetical protein QJS04_geneDACA023875 [Acorus gramineus]
MWGDLITKPGQIFHDVDHFRRDLRNFSIAHEFDYHVIKSDRIRVTARCAAHNCS